MCNLILVAMFIVLMHYYMQGSAADIIKVAMLKLHSVITNGSSAVDSMDGVMQKFSGIRGHCHLLLQVWPSPIFVDSCIYFFSIDRFKLCLHFVGA
jgi:DNA polymerase theta